MADAQELILTVEATGEVVTLSVAFTDEERARLEEFVQYAVELLETKYVQHGMPAW